MNYTFALNFHGDVILQINESIHDLGYNFMRELPLVLWLYIKQISGENVFKIFDVPDEKAPLDNDLEELVNETRESYRKLPLSTQDFNQELDFLGIGQIYSGNNKNFYQLRMDENNFLSFSSRNQSFTFSPDESRNFLREYKNFLDNEERLKKYNKQVHTIIDLLKND